MPNTFFTDENVDGPAIEQARSRGVDIVTAADASLLRADDPVVFEYASQHGYVVVTGNVKHYPLLLAAWYETHESHPGILYVKPEHQKNSTLIAKTLVEFADQSLADRVEWI